MAQGLTHSPYSRSLPLTSSPKGIIAYLRAASFAVWMLTLLLPYLLVRDWSSWNEFREEGVDFRKYFYVGFAVFCAAHLTVGIGAWISAPFKILKTWAGILLTIFCGFELLVSPMSTVPKTSALYAVATWAVIALLTLYWQSDYRVLQRMTLFAGMLAFAWLFFLCVKLGVHIGMGIGGINRNMTGMAGVGALVCCMIYPRKEIRWIGVACALFMALIVSSRGSLVSLAAFGLAYYVAYHGTYRAVIHGLLAAVAVAALLLVIPHLRHGITNDVLMLHDRDRGIDSGFTGRMDFWKEALAKFQRSPLIGYGFRGTIESNGLGSIHSGYLKLLVETGIIGTFLAVTAIVVECLRRFRLAVELRGLTPRDLPNIDLAESVRLNAVACGTMAMTLTYWIYEQLYLNLGSVVSVALFLMITAPAYVPLMPKTSKR